jgi:hypothetical protein
MDEAARKLEIDFDTGDETRAVQERIMDQLDEAIKVASVRRQVRSLSGESSSGDKRRRSTGERSRSEDSSRSSRDGEDASTSETVGETGSEAQGDRVGGDLRESRRTWGHLPRRERDEVIQGIGETSLERYRAWIERYYRALQESQE